MRPTLLALTAIVAAITFEPVLASELPISGRVVDKSGTPMAGAQITLQSLTAPHAIGKLALSGAPAAPPAARAESDTQGSFRLIAPSAGVWRVRVDASGFVPLESAPLVLLEETTLSDAALLADEGLLVRVAMPDGTPAAGALVRGVFDQRGPRFGAADWSPPEWRLARTAADGTARLPRGANEKLNVNAGLSGFVPASSKSVRATKLALTLAKGTAIPLEISNADGKPLGDVIVATGEPAVVAGVSDVAGRVVVTMAPGTDVNAVAASADGRVVEQTLHAPSAAPVTPVRISFPAIVNVSGRVIDVETRRPVIGALIGPRARRWQSVRSGSDGSFSISMPKRGLEPDLLVAATGYLDASQELALESINPAVTIALSPAAAVAGVVADERGTPIAGARVAVTMTPQGPRMMRRGFWRAQRNLPETRTNARGAFKLTRLDPDNSYELSAKAVGFAAATQELVALQRRQTKTGVTLTLRPGLTIEGVVVDGDGKPVPSAIVSARLTPADRQGRVMVIVAGAQEGNVAEPSAISDSDGKFSIGDLSAGRYDLSAARRGFASTKLPGIELNDKQPRYDAGRIALEPGETIQGQVLDKSGAPIDAAEVRIAPADPIAAMRMRFQRSAEPDARTGPDGWFALEDRRRGETIDLSVSREGYVVSGARGVQVPPLNPLTITLDASSKVSGRVVDLEGKPIVGATIGLQRTRSEGFGGRGMQFQMRNDESSDAEGKFLFDAVDPGTIALEASAPGMQKKSMPSVEVPSGKDITDVSFVLEAGATLEGRVLSSDGQPVAGAEVGAVEEGGERTMMRGMSERSPTDGDGRYRLESLIPGTLSIEATSDSYPRTVKSLELKPGLNRLDLTFSGGLDVSGRVVDQNGAAIVGALVRLDAPGRFFGGPQAQSGSDGSFRLTGIAPGDYSLNASRAGFAPLDDEVPVRVEAAPVAGLLIKLAQGGAISGTILGLDPKQFGEVEVRADRAGWNGVRPDFKGNYRIENLAPGDYSVEARWGTSGRRATGTVTLPQGAPEVRLDLSFGQGIALSGSVMQGQTPAEGAVVAVVNLDADGNGWGRTDHEGKFRIEALEPARYRLDLTWNGATHTETLDLSSDREISIDLPAATVSGLLIDAQNNQPVVGASVTLEAQAEQQGPRFWMGDRGATSDSSGRFILRNVGDDTYRLQIKSKGYAAREQMVTLQSGRGGENLEIKLDPTEGITFDVRLSSGAIPEDVRVAVLDATGRVTLSGNYPTGENGRVRVSTVPPGTWEVLVTAGGGSTSAFGINAPGGPFTVTVPPASSLRVRVKDLAQAGSQATLTITGSDGRRYRTLRPWGALQDQWRVQDGSASIEALPPGNWSLRVDSTDGRSWQATAVSRPGVPVEVQM